MKVELVQHTDNPVKLLTDIASICYGKKEAKHPEKLLKHLVDNNHHSVLEHAFYTFKIEGISRACLGQLTRHRHASYTVRSQRYCDESEQFFITPDEINKGDAQEKIYLDAVQNVYDAYRILLNLGIKKEDARMILPMATATDLYMSLNLRELIHIYKLRSHKSAQWEIRDLVNEMVKLVVDVSPELEFMFKEE